jgi:hypothetical protein
MKYLLLLTLLLASSILTKKVIIDLDNKDRTGSQYLNQLTELPENIISSLEIGSETKFNSTINTDITFTVNDTTTLSSMNADLKITTKDKETVEYNLTLLPIDNCIYVDFPEKKFEADVNCTYSHGAFTDEVTQVETMKSFKKEVAFGRYVLRLTEEGKLEVDIVKGNGLESDNDEEAKVDRKAFEKLEGLVIKDFFIQVRSQWYGGILLILTEDGHLNAIYYSDLQKQIKLFEHVSISLNELGINPDEVTNIYNGTTDGYFVFLKNGFYIVKKDKNDFLWEAHLTSRLEYELNTYVDLIDINAIAIEESLKKYACISIKGFGVVFITFKDGINVISVFKHNHVIGLQPTISLYDTFNVGVLIDNQSDPNVNEFFIELVVNLYDAKEVGIIYLNRVLISSQPVKAVQTDYLNKMLLFAIGTNVYIVPRSIYRINTMPIYIHKSATDAKNIKLGFLHVDDSRQNNVVLFRQTIDEAKQELVSLYRKPKDREEFACQFKKEGDYVITISKRYLSLMLDLMNLRDFVYHIHVETAAWGMLLIILLAVGAALIIIGFIFVIACIRYRRRKNAALLMEQANYRAV